MSEASVKSDPEFCLRPNIEKTNSDDNVYKKINDIIRFLPTLGLLWHCLQSRIITKKHANFLTRTTSLLLLEKSGLVTILANGQIGPNFDQILVKTLIKPKFLSLTP